MANSNPEKIPEVKFAKTLAKKLESPTSLTEFAPLGSEEKSSGSHFFSRLFGRNKTQKTIIDISNKLEEEDFTKEDDNASENEANPLANTASLSGSCESNLPDLHNKSMKEGDLLYGRSVSSVIRRISGLLDRRNTTISNPLQTYRDSDFKQYWMPDSNCKECYECSDKFTTFRRRHHCRICGQIFCSRCCNQGIPGKLMGYSGDLRVCTYCCKVVLSYIQSLDSATELSGDVRALQEDLAQKLMLSIPDHRTQVITHHESNRARRKSSTVGFREEDIARAKFLSHSELEYSASNSDLTIITLDRRQTPQDDNNLREIWLQMKNSSSGLDFQSHRHRLRTYNNCVVGSTIVDWLIRQGKASNRAQASALAQSLMDAKILTSVTNDHTFFDGYALYQAGEMCNLIESPGLSPEITQSPETHQESHDPLWLKEIQPTESDLPCEETDDSIEIDNQAMDKSLNRHSSLSRLSSSSSTFYLDLNVQESRVTLTKPHKEKRTPLAESSVAATSRFEQIPRIDLKEDILKGTKFEDQSKGGKACDIFVYSSQMFQENSVERASYDALNTMYEKLEQNLLYQLLSSEGLPLTWCDTILPIIHRVADTVRPDIKNDNDDMDIRQYVQIKKIPGGNKNECCIVRGVVCTKNVAHKKMKDKIVNPTILLLSNAIVYQRIENKLSSLDPLLMQEFEYLKNTIGKISIYKPDILLVEKTVSRVAQEMLLDLGITVALNVKPSVMERVARCTQAGIVSSIDAHLGRPQLGVCYQFRVNTYQLSPSKSKTFMFFDGCASNLGCTVILRGGSYAELKKVKQIIQFMIYVAYNWRLERSFLMDESALPPPQCDDLQLILDSSTEQSAKIEVGQDAAKVQLRDKSTTSKVVVAAKSANKTVTNSELGSSLTDEYDKKQPCKTYIEDFSDPLRCYIDKGDDSVFIDPEITLQVESLPFSNDFRKALDDVILCISPNIKMNLPFLETESGRNCVLRSFFAEEIFWSNQFTKESLDSGSKRNTMEIDNASNNSISTLTNNLLNGENLIMAIQPPHPFVMTKLTSSFNDSVSLQGLLADFRARGGRLRNACLNGALNSAPIVSNGAQNNQVLEKSLKSKASDGVVWERKVDALTPYNHQRLAVLFCSYSPSSTNAPGFCVCPWVVNMDFYGRNDIPLGGFLERYCFRQSYVCPSPSCDTPMTAHIRKFAHDNGCVQIYLDKLDTDIPACKSHILMWSWCKACKETTPVVAMSQDTWSLSFAKYLELRFHGGCYGRRGSNEDCQHSLHHEHIQYFVYQELVVSFKFHSILMREVSIPPIIISIQDNPIPLSAIVEEIKTLAVKGYGIYSNILEHLFTLKSESQNTGTKQDVVIQEMMDRQEIERSIFRERIESIQLNLTSPTLENKHISSFGSIDATKDVCNIMWKIADSVILLKIQIAEAVFNWNTKIIEFVSAKKKEIKVTVYSRASSSSGINAESASSQEALTAIIKQSDDSMDSINPPLTFSSTSTCTTSTSTDSTVPTSNASTTQSWKTSSSVSTTQSVKLEQSISSIPELDEHSPCKRTIKDSKETPDKLNYSVTSSWNEVSSSDLRDISNEVFEKSDETLNEDMVLPLPKKEAEEIKVQRVLEKLEAASVLTESVIDPSMTTSRSSSSLSSYTYGTSPALYGSLLGQVPEQGEKNDNSNDNANSSAETNADKKSDSSGGGKGHERSKSDGAEKLLESFKSAASSKLKLSDDDNSGKSEKKERGSMKNLISQLLSSSTLTPIPSPFPPNEHLLLPPSDKVPVIVYDNEPGSIIAYTLSSSDYEQQLIELKMNINTALINSQNQKEASASPILKKRFAKTVDRSSSVETVPENSPNHPKKATGVLSFFRGPDKSSSSSQYLKNTIASSTSSSTSSSSNTTGGGSNLANSSGGGGANLGVFDAVHYMPSRSEREIVDEDKDEVNFTDFALCSSQEEGKGGGKTSSKCSNMHIEVQFSDNSTRFYCRVYFAEQFRKLRTILFPDGEERYIRSLARCVPWMARGGKSGSTFCKTHDDRFILKQMSRFEVPSFLEFAPKYFNHINRCCAENKPTVLAKIVGVYRIGFKNTATNTASKLDLLVMENLFYNRNISQKFDLKGSVRNRLVPTSDQEGEDTVLLDENLVKIACENPLYIRPHSKTVLSLAINNDALFLYTNSVMDYSLLVGLDENKKELVVGIIDYIRTFTWDKRIEMVVKSTGILGGHGKLPTVVYPEAYKIRFCEAMDHYFLWVPDQWSGLGRGLDS